MEKQVPKGGHERRLRGASEHLLDCRNVLPLKGYGKRKVALTVRITHRTILRAGARLELKISSMTGRLTACLTSQIDRIVVS